MKPNSMTWESLLFASTLAIVFFFPLFSETKSGLKSQKERVSFNRSKKDLLEKVYFDQKITFYCNQPFTSDQKIDWGRNTASLNLPKRALRLEWEHVVPAHAFGQAFPEWREGHPDCLSKKGKFKGRNCASKTNSEFRKMEADMHNLVPAIGEVNQRRSNHSFAELGKAPEIFPGCPMKKLKNKVEPPENRKGDVARIYMYMDQAYPGRGIISQKNRPLFESWNRMDPVDSWECTRYRRIQKVQTGENPVLKELCATFQ